MAAPTFVQGIAANAAGGVAPGATFTLTLGADPAPGNLLVAGVCAVVAAGLPTVAMPSGFVARPDLDDTTSGKLTSVMGYRQARGAADRAITWTNPVAGILWNNAQGFIAEYTLANAIVEAAGHKKVAVDPGAVVGILVNAGSGPRVIIAMAFANANPGAGPDITPHGPWVFRLTANVTAPAIRLWMGDALVDAVPTAYQPTYANTGATSEVQDKTIDFASGGVIAVPDAFGGMF